MSRVYADPALPYSQSTTFEPITMDLCHSEFFGEDEYDSADETVDETLSGAFD